MNKALCDTRPVCTDYGIAAVDTVMALRPFHSIFQVAWDSNEYQLDMADPADRQQYKRLISRNKELGIPHMVRV